MNQKKIENRLNMIKLKLNLRDINVGDGVRQIDKFINKEIPKLPIGQKRDIKFKCLNFKKKIIKNHKVYK